MKNTGKRSSVRIFTWLVIATGLGAVLFSALRLSPASLDPSFLLLTLITLEVGTRTSLRIPRTNGHVSLSDGFIVLVMLLFEAEAAILLAAVASFCAASRSGQRWATVLFRSALTTVSALLAAWLLRSQFGSLVALPYGDAATLIFAVCMAAVVLAVFHSGNVAAEEDDQTASASMRGLGTNFLWAFAVYFALTAGAGAVAMLTGVTGLYPFLAAATVVAAVNVANTYLHMPTAQEMASPSVQNKTVMGVSSSLKENDDLYRSAFDHAAVGMAMVSSNGRWLRVNRALCEILGYSESELLATDFQKVTHPDDLSSALANIKEVVSGKYTHYQMEKRYVHRSGQLVWVLWGVARVSDETTGAVKLIFQIQDNTDRKRAEERLLHDAFHDALTGLPNRALFTDHLKLTVARMRRHEGHTFAVLFLDLDRFKVINDSLGHMIGDQLLVGIARRLEACLRPGDTVARVGGDEFTILLEELKDETEAISIAERIQKEISAPFILSGREVFTTVSIGIALSTTGSESPEDILRDADTAMYRAKSLGKARHEVFDKAMHAVAMNVLQLETDLRRVLERKELFIQYQPIVSLDTFNLRGFEALVRWRHPERGLISPLDFIPVAEDTGQILPIGQWVLKEACKQMHWWQKRYVSDGPLFISVNLSSRQFTQPNLLEQVKNILEETKLSPRSLKLEITESVVMENIDTAAEMLKQLRALGVQLSIDDFGTGYSSLSYLHRFPIDTLKIDRSFVTRMVDNGENTEIVRTIIMLAQTLGMDVVAEGVETKEQLALLRRLGCESGQGYFFSKPIGIGGAEKILADTCIPLEPKTDDGQAMMGDKVKSIRPAAVA